MIRIYKRNLTSGVFSIYFGKKELNQINSKEIVFNRIDLKIRVPSIDDNKTLKIHKGVMSFSSYDNQKNIDGYYKLKKINEDEFSLILIKNKNVKSKKKNNNRK